MKNLITICTIFCTSLSLFAQNYIYDQNQSGFTLEAFASFPEDSSAYGLNPSYTWNGRLTAGLAITEQSFDNVDTKATILSPNISYLFLKKTVGENLLNIGINSSYSTTSYSDLNNLKSNAFDIGLGASMKFNLSDSFDFTIGTNVSWGSLTVKLNSEKDSENLTQYGFYGNFLFDKFIIQPQVAFVNILEESDSAFSISIGYIFDK